MADLDALHNEVDHRFTYHPPTGNQPETYEKIRAWACQLAHELVDIVPPGRELSLALTHLEEVVMFANAGIARS